MGESYFGGKRKGERGRGAAGKVAAFGIPERAGKAYTVAVPDYREGAPMAEIEAATVKGSVSYTDELSSYNDLSWFGKHAPIDHSEAYAGGPAHIDGLEWFRSYAEGLHRPCHGADPENFPVDLAEDEFRYNHRDEHLLTILFERLDKPELIKGRLP